MRVYVRMSDCTRMSGFRKKLNSAICVPKPVCSDIHFKGRLKHAGRHTHTHTYYKYTYIYTRTYMFEALIHCSRYREWSVAHAKILYMISFFAQASDSIDQHETWLRHPHLVALIHAVTTSVCMCMYVYIYTR